MWEEKKKKNVNNVEYNIFVRKKSISGYKKKKKKRVNFREKSNLKIRGVTRTSNLHISRLNISNSIFSKK